MAIINYIIVMAKTSKICDYCGGSFTPTNPQRKRCSKACWDAKIAEQRRQRYAANPERVLERNRRWHRANPGKKAEYDRRHRQANLERLREYDRKRGKARREGGKERERLRQFRADNPDKNKEYTRRYRAKKQDQLREKGRKRYHDMGGNGYRRHWPVLLKRDGPKCGICGGHLDPHTEEFHVDHILPVARGGDSSLDNLQLAHPSCNSSKRASLNGAPKRPTDPPPQLSLFNEATHEQDS